MLLAFVLGLTRAATAQGVVVAPHAIYLDHRTRSGSLTLYNPGAEPVEVTISSMFGYPVTDSLGDFTLLVPDSVDASMPAATAWIDAFPRRMTLQPLQRQTIRLLARPPATLTDGEYWSRVVISAKGGAVPISASDSTGIQIGLTFEVRTILPLIYRKGPLHTGVVVYDLRAVPQGDSLAVRVRLERRGTAAYVGTAKATLVDSTGAVVASVQEPVAIYYNAEPSFILPITGLHAGSYRLHLALTTERSDIMPDLLLRAPASRDSVAVVLP